MRCSFLTVIVKIEKKLKIYINLIYQTMASQTASYSSLNSKIYRSRNILLNILKQRGYDISDYYGFSITEVHSMYQHQQLDMILKHPKTKRKIFVKYHLGSKLKGDGRQLYEYIDDLYELEQILSVDDELIIITKDKLNDSLKNIINQVYIKDKKFINIYNLNDYLFNILEHNMVPPHKPLTNEQKKKIKKEYYITDESQFPEISRFDPVAQAIGLRPGQLVEITRSTPTAITTKYYRLCY